MYPYRKQSREHPHRNDLVPFVSSKDHSGSPDRIGKR